jgi:hypothetical protein
MSPRISTPVVRLAALVLALLSGGCGSPDYVAVPRGEDVAGGLSRARASSFPIYYAGRTFAGLPLTDVELEGPDRALIAYGTCRIALPADGGCSVPVQIQHFAFNPSNWRGAVVNCDRQPSLLGVPTVRHDGLVLFTEGRIVKIYARSAAEDRQVALALRRVTDDKLVRRLPAPKPRITELQARVCQ